MRYVKRMKTFIALAALLFTSCHGKTNSSKAGVDESAKKSAIAHPNEKPDDNCKATVSEFREWLRVFAKEGGRQTSRPNLNSGILLAQNDALLEKDVNSAISVSLSPNVVMVEGEHIAQGVDEKLGKFLSVAKNEYVKRRNEASPSLALYIDTKTLWKKVVDTTEIIAAAGFTTIHVAFLAPPAKKLYPLHPLLPCTTRSWL